MFSDLVVGYLFLGGCSAGLLVYACAVDLAAPLLRRSPGGLGPDLLGKAYLAAACGMALGILCLLADLGRPDRVMALLAHPSLSAISVGAYALGISLVCALALGLTGALRFEVPNAAVRGLEGVACAVGSVTAAYTGVLLAQMGSAVALWNAALGPLFFLSSLSAGAAGFGLMGYVESGGAAGPSPLGRRAMLVIGLLEVLSVLAWVAICLGSGALGALVGFWATGEGACFLACFCGLGLAVPLVLEAIWAARPAVLAISSIAPVLTIAGAFCLRYCLVNVPIV